MGARKGGSLDDQDGVAEAGELPGRHGASRTAAKDADLGRERHTPNQSGRAARRSRTVRLQAVVQPAADVVTGRAPAMDHLVVAAAAAQVARPAAATRLLAVHVAVGEPGRLAVAVDALLEVPQRARGVADKAMAGGELAVGRHADIAGAGSAGVGPVRSLVDLAQSVDQVGERIAFAGHDAALELAAAGNHLVEHESQLGAAHLVATGGRAEHGREPDAVKAEADQLVEGLAQVEVARRHRDPRRDLHSPLAGEEGGDALHRRVVAAAPALVWTQPIVHLPRPVEADGDGEAEALEELGVFGAKKRAVGGDEAHHRAAGRRERRRTLRGQADHGAAGERLAAQESEIESLARRGAGYEQEESTALRSAVAASMLFGVPPNSPCWA